MLDDDLAPLLEDYFRSGAAKEDMMTQLSDIAVQLKEPFLFDDIDLLPKSKVERDGKTLCMALPYADPRVYQDRLNSIAYGEWSTPAPVVIAVGGKLICYVTVIVYGVPHTDVGEADAGENQGTEAWAQAFKRACSQFGLGRYLYDLDKEWVPFNPQKKMIDLDTAGKRAIVRKMYQKAGIIEAQPVYMASEKQITSINKLCEYLDKPAPHEALSYEQAKAMLEALTLEYRQMREAQKASEKPATSQPHTTTSYPSQTVSRPSGDVVEASGEEVEKMMGTVKSLLASHYQIPLVDQPAKWQRFKKEVLGLPVEDEGLTMREVKRLREVIDAKIKQAKGAA